jgi:soluble lytic murein transglycosylase-like protein
MKRRILQFGLRLGTVVLFTGSVFAANPSVPTRTVYDATLSNGFTIHHLRHETVGLNTRLYTSESSFIDVPSSDIVDMAESQEEQVQAAAPEFQAPSAAVKTDVKADVKDVVAAASYKHQIDADFINSVIHAESGFNPHAISPKGARGLMQLMPGTATQLGVNDPFNPAANVDAGTKYLRELLLRYNGDLAKTLAAYNAGPGRVEQYHGVPPYHETRAYVTRIINDFNRKKLAAKSAPKSQPKAKTAASSSVKGQ